MLHEEQQTFADVSTAAGYLDRCFSWFPHPFSETLRQFFKSLDSRTVLI
jgi:hypothetical protein